jgi:hypothetical protein
VHDRCLSIVRHRLDRSPYNQMQCC